MDAWVRKRLFEFLKTDSDFEAFCQDHFPETTQRFGAAMDRQARISLLLQREGAKPVLQRLRDEFPGLIPPGPPSSDPDVRVEVSLRQRAFGHGDPYLHCDRGKQFAYMRGAMARPDHQVVLLPGSQGEAHEFFLARLEVALPGDIPRKVLRVPWRKARPPSPSFPVDRRDFEAALLLALGHPQSSETSLASALSRSPQHHVLVLLHPVVRRGYEHAALVQYYTDWLPTLLSSLRTEYPCKLVQPIEWQPAPPKSAPDATPSAVPTSSEAAARDLIRRLMSQRKAKLIIEATNDLAPITRPDIDDFLTVVGYASSLPPDECQAARQEFLAAVFSEGASSEQILRKIHEELPDDL